MNNKIGAKDLITLGIFTVIYFVIGAALSLLVSIPIMVPFFPAVWALINGTVFMLYSTKVEKFGLVTLMAVLTGLLVGLTGMGFWCVPTGLVFGLLGGYGTEYGMQVMSLTPWWSLIIFVGLNFICGMLGAVIGKKIMKKHFEKAGIL